MKTYKQVLTVSVIRAIAAVALVLAVSLALL